MKKNLIRITAFMLMLLMLLVSCGPAVPAVDETTDTTEAPQTEADTSNDIYIERPNKEVKNILMIGNSFCYYFVEELYGLAKADGYSLNVANLYRSGRVVEDHWEKGVVGNEKNYEFYVVSDKYKGNRKAITKAASVQSALDYAKTELGTDWDVITLQQHFYPSMAVNYDKCVQETQGYAKKLFDFVRGNNPDSTLYWHETWAYQVGYGVKEKYVEGATVPGETMPDVETQTLTYENIKKASQLVADDNGVTMIPSAEAWQIARADARVGDNMCARLGINGDLGDYYHDGDIGGGQYLNACVWYEVLMGESCIGNTWRPTNYTLSEDMIAGLQEAAHAAVAAMYGPGYAK